MLETQRRQPIALERIHAEEGTKGKHKKLNSAAVTIKQKSGVCLAIAKAKGLQNEIIILDDTPLRSNKRSAPPPLPPSNQESKMSVLILKVRCQGPAAL